MPTRVSLIILALSAATAPAFAHLDPVAHGTNAADHHHPFTGIEPLVVLVLTVVAILAIAGRLRRRTKSAQAKKDVR